MGLLCSRFSRQSLVVRRRAPFPAYLVRGQSRATQFGQGYGTAKAVPLRKKQNQIHCENALRLHGPRTKLGVLRLALGRLAPSRSLRMTVLFFTRSRFCAGV